MATYTKQFLSGSSYGTSILIDTTATPGTLIHTADASNMDEVYLYAINTSDADVFVTVEFGGVTSPDNTSPVLIESKSGLVPLIPGIPLSNSKVVRVFAATANVITICGFVNRIS